MNSRFLLALGPELQKCASTLSIKWGKRVTTMNENQANHQNFACCWWDEEAGHIILLKKTGNSWAVLQLPHLSCLLLNLRYIQRKWWTVSEFCAVGLVIRKLCFYLGDLPETNSCRKPQMRQWLIFWGPDSLGLSFQDQRTCRLWNEKVTQRNLETFLKSASASWKTSLAWGENSDTVTFTMGQEMLQMQANSSEKVTSYEAVSQKLHNLIQK